MRREILEPRPHWQKKVEQYGLHYHTLNQEPYWDESACYVFTAHQIDQIELATNTLHQMCIELVQEVIDNRMFALFMIPQAFEDWIIQSWEEDWPHLYGRFDLAYDGSGAPKLLEYNADTPTGLVEAAVAQWFWLKEIHPHGDQFNSIHDKLIAAWKQIQQKQATLVHFTAMADQVEDYITVEYLRDTAMQAGIETAFLDIAQIGYDRNHLQFVDQDQEMIQSIFKLYPWEWLLQEQFGVHLLQSRTQWIEPPWKMILSCKSILPLLWERYPDCPYLLQASFEPLDIDHIAKPIHAREGANISIFQRGKEQFRTEGPYHGPKVYQQIGPMRSFDGRYPVLGSWLIDGESCGLGIREDATMITQNTSRFLPHRMI